EVPSVSVNLLRDLNLQPASSYPSGLLTIGAIDYFRAYDGVHTGSLWRTDGTAAGTYMVKDVNVYSLDLNLNAAIVFHAGDFGNELWSTDGTAAGTQLIKTFNASSPTHGYVSGLTSLGSVAVFSASDSDLAQHELWETDGTAAGTFLLSSVEV